MPIIRRAEKKKRYTVTDNSIIEDPELSGMGLAVLIYILSKPDNWQVRKHQLVRRFYKATLNSIEVAFRNLRLAGYMRIHHVQDEKTGKLKGSYYVVSEIKRPPVTEMARSSEVGRKPRPGNIATFSNN